MKRLVMATVALLLATTLFAQEDDESTAGSPVSKIQVGFKGGVGLASMSGETWGFSQSLELYLENDASGDVTSSFKKSGNSGPVFGAFLNYRINSQFSIQPEFLYVKKGAKVKGTGSQTFTEFGSISYSVTEKLNLTYLEIPVLAKFSIPTQGKIRPSLFAGPAMGVKLSGEYDLQLVMTAVGDGVETVRWTGKPDISNMKSTDFGLVFGGDVDIALGRASLILDVRYTMGLSGQFDKIDLTNFTDWHPDDPTPKEYPVVTMDSDIIPTGVPDMKNKAFSITAGVAFNL